MSILAFNFVFILVFCIHTKYKYTNIQLHSLNLISYFYTIVVVQLANAIMKVNNYDIILKKLADRADNIFPNAFHTG